MLSSKPEFYVGGYFLVEGADLDDWVDGSLLPKRRWDLSPCLNMLHPAFCSLSWFGASPDEREKYRKHLGLDEKWYAAMQNDVESQFDKERIGWGEMFLDLETARGHAAAYLGKVPDVKLFMVALEASHRERLLRDEAPEEGNGVPGIYLMLKSGIRADLSNGVRGYDVLGYDLGSFHSFACNQLEGIFHERLGLTFNENGLLKSYEDAEKASELVDTGDIGAEPVLWQPWVVTELPLRHS
jgi:hypothetical protein